MINPQTDKILIGIPTTGMVDWQFASSLAMIILPCPSIFMWTIRTMIDEARNMIVREAVKEDRGYTHVLMMDDDQSFEQEALRKLYYRDVDVCSAVVFQRKDPYMPCVYKKLSDGFHPFFPKEFSEIDGFGTGFVLFKIDVFKKISHPWFETYYDKSGEHWSVDLDFSNKVFSSGIKMFADPSVIISHLGDKQIIDSVFVDERLAQGKTKLITPEELKKLNSNIV